MVAKAKGETKTREEETSNQSTETTNQTSKLQSTAEEETEYLLCKVKFDYGGRNKSYGLIICILEKRTQKLFKLDLLRKDQDFDLRLESNLRRIVEFYRNQITNYRSQQLAEKLSVSLTQVIIEKIIAAAEKNNGKEIEAIIKEKLEDILQESIRLELNWEVIFQSDLEEVYPDLFESQSEEEAEETEAESTTGVEDISQITKENEEGIDARLELKCNPIVSAIRGRRVTQLDPGEKLLVNITDKRELGQDLSELLEHHNGAAIGTVEEIDYNQELNRYRVTVKFKRNIYGKLVAEPEVKIMLFEEDEPEPQQNIGFNWDQNIIFLFGGVGIIVVLLIIIIILI